MEVKAKLEPSRRFTIISIVLVVLILIAVTQVGRVIDYFQPKQEVIEASAENCVTYGKKTAILSLYASKAELARDYKGLCEVLPKIELSYEQATQGCNLPEAEVLADAMVWYTSKTLEDVKSGLDNYRVLCDTLYK